MSGCNSTAAASLERGVREQHEALRLALTLLINAALEQRRAINEIDRGPGVRKGRAMYRVRKLAIRDAERACGQHGHGLAAHTLRGHHVVVRHDDRDVVAMPGEPGRQPGGDVAETADFRQRREFGADRQDAQSQLLRIDSTGQVAWRRTASVVLPRSTCLTPL